ncbi:cysteine desulfurase [Lasius niger]|uniref:Cysteine desulfurase n=1 Tax=Lasius niger TaxID=67767 RepID=A0A0J7MMN3_LASNI|nr:cysteine desulfurase [Lasius niger]
MYLVRVWAGARSSTICHTFDQLRAESYASVGRVAFPPTTTEIRGHIQRGAFLVHRAIHLLTTSDEHDAVLPLEHRWEEHFGTSLPSK